MDRFALIQDGVVINVAVGEPMDGNTWLAMAGYINAELAGPGWTFDGTTFTAPPWQNPTPEPTPEPTPAP